LTGGSVILIHHTGKNIGAGMRGHSSLFAAMDGVIEVCKEDNGSRLWSVAKSKDGADGGRHSFDLHLVHLPPDDEGFPQTSCVPVAVEATAQAANRDAGKRAADELMKKQLRYDLLNEIRDAQGIGVPLSRSDAHAKVGGRKQTSVEVLALLEHEGWVHEIDVPSKARKNNRRSSFLIALTTDQHDEWLKTKTIAPELREVPQSWRKVETATDSVCSRDFPEDAINSKRNESAIVTDFVCSHSVCSPKEKTNGNEREQSENCSPFFSQLPDVGTNGNKREQTGTNEKITPNCGQSDTQEVSIAIDVPQTEERIAQTDTAPDVPDVSSSGAKKAKKVGKKSAIKKVADDVALGDSPLSEKNQSTDTPAVPDAVAMDAPPAVERTGTQQADGLTDAPPAYVPSKHRHTTNEWFDLAMNAVGSDGVLTRKAWTAWIKTQFPPEKAGSARATLSNAEKALVAKGLIVRDGDSFRRA
jgi:hypothetical protein